MKFGPRHSTRMKVIIFVFVSLTVSSAFSNEADIIDIGEEKDITDANQEFGADDILQFDRQRSAIINDNRLWTSPVAYILDDSLEMNAKGVILKALDQFRLKSCIDFKPWDSEDYYIHVKKLGGCFSYIGRVIAKGQDLSIGRYCDEISTVEHEFLHAFGFFHEQSRYDRDNFVTINLNNVIQGYENNFLKTNKEDTTTSGIPYDYWSVMHYSSYAFSNGNGTTINTKDPKYQNVIGQRLEVSPSDVKELNLRYKCNSTIAFQMYCGFSDRSMCQMNRCSQSGIGWEMVTKAQGGPNSDHTDLPSGDTISAGQGYFMHASTASGKEGDSAMLETHRMRPSRDCHIQCLQFYYYHSGTESDRLNIWLREFKDDSDVTGNRRLMGQITGSKTAYWQLQHVSLDATKHFQVEFEALKGAGSSSGGFSIDDINLSEIECPQVTLQIDDFENVMKTSDFGTMIKSTRQYSSGGYSYLFGFEAKSSYFGLFVQLLSGKNDDKLQWPVPQRQVTFQALDQIPDIKLQMSKQRSITSDQGQSSDGSYYWDDPRKVGTKFVDENGETAYAGPKLGKTFFMDVNDMKSRDYLKGKSAIFVFRFQDLTPVVNGSALPCPKVQPVAIKYPPTGQDNGPCSSGTLTTTRPPPTTTDGRTLTTTRPPPTTTDGRTLTTTRPPPKTTEDSIFGFSPALMASPVLTLLLALMLLMR